MRSIARWCYSHRRIVVVGWLVLVGALVGISSAVGTSFDNSLSLPGTDSSKALRLLTANAPTHAGDAEQIVIAARHGATLTDAAVRSRAEALFAKLITMPDVTRIVSPYASAGAAQMNRDRTVAFAALTLAKATVDYKPADGQRLIDVARSFRTDQLDVAVGGPVAAKGEGADLGGVGIGVLAALLVLFVVFGSLLAAVLPLLSALLALPAAMSVVGLVSHLVGLPDFTGEVVILIGLGVGVDYALFIVTRVRQALQAGHDVESAIVMAVSTTGRAVLFAGAVVCAALLGLVTLGIGLLTGIGIAASIGVLFTVATSLTLLPALLGFFGTKVLSRRQRHRGGVSADPETGLWSRWSAFIARRPAVPAIVALALICALALPIFSLRMGSADQGNASPSNSTRQAYDLLARGFGPGFNGPLQVVAEVANGDEATLGKLTSALAADPGVSTVSQPATLAHQGAGRVVALEVYPTTAPQNAETTQLVQRMRSRVIPEAVSATTVQAYVGGATATSVDFNDVVAGKMPLFIAIVLLLSFVLLVVLLRSILIPLTATVMNVLSTAAVLGTLSAAFGWGWGGELLDATRPGPVEAALAVMVFAILFGLSMDYQVFLASRIQEEWRRTGDNAEAVTRGLAVTGRTITAAAIIMMAVFGSFILGGDRLIKMFGLGLTTAVFVDAFLIRVAIVPAVMFRLGRANWWLPTRLQMWLGKVTLHADVDAVRQPAAAPEEVPVTV